MTDAQIEKRRARNRKAQAKYRKLNPEKSRMAVLTWAQKFPGRRMAHRAASKSRKGGIAKWADMDLMGDIYMYAKIMRDAGVNATVDHVVPLNGGLVSGLHCESNLTVLLFEDNDAKGATFEVLE